MDNGHTFANIEKSDWENANHVALLKECALKAHSKKDGVNYIDCDMTLGYVDDDFFQNRYRILFNNFR